MHFHGDLLRQLQDIFSEAKRNTCWVVEIDAHIVGMFGIESRSDEATQLRRVHLDRPYRGHGIAQRMLQCAEARARELVFTKLILSTAEVQEAAIAFYRKSGYRLVRTELALAEHNISVPDPTTDVRPSPLAYWPIPRRCN